MSDNYAQGGIDIFRQLFDRKGRRHGADQGFIPERFTHSGKGLVLDWDFLRQSFKD